ncbi:MAG: manganese efflux pump MntP family protein [Desulfocapsaceae bacterium]
MDLFSTLVIAVGLGMDAFAVSVASGVSMKQIGLRQTLTIAASFALFQALMPVLGWAAGLSFRNYIAAYDHWIAFGLLAGIGLRMIYEARRLEDDKPSELVMTGGRLLLLSIATSIDALAVGLSFAVLNIVIFTPALIIGFVTGGMSHAGIILGRKVGHLFEGKIEIIGGIILILIGLKILLEHTVLAPV